MKREEKKTTSEIETGRVGGCVCMSARYLIPADLAMVVNELDVDL